MAKEKITSLFIESLLSFQSIPVSEKERTKSKSVNKKKKQTKDDAKVKRLDRSLQDAKLIFSSMFQNLLTIKGYSTAEKYLLTEFYASISSKSLFREIAVAEDLDDEVVIFQLNRANDDPPSIVYVFR